MTEDLEIKGNTPVATRACMENSFIVSFFGIVQLLQNIREKINRFTVLLMTCLECLAIVFNMLNVIICSVLCHFVCFVIALPFVFFYCPECFLFCIFFGFSFYCGLIIICAFYILENFPIR